MPWYPYQGSFAGGEISPRLYGETSSPWYKHGVEFSENFLHLPQGPVRYRIGSEYIIHAASDAGIRLIPFNTISPAGQSLPDLVLELTAGEARLVNEDGVVHLSPAGQLILNNDFSLGAASWGVRGGYTAYEWIGSQALVKIEVPFWESTWDPSGGGPLHPPLPPPVVAPFIRQKLANVVAGPYRLQVSFPALDSSDFNPLANLPWNAGTGYIKVGTAPGLSDLYGSVGHYNDSVDTIVNVAAGPADIWVEFGQDVPATYNYLVKVSFPRFTGATSGDAVKTGLPWTDDMLPGIQYAQDIFYGMVLVHPKMPPQKVTYSGAAFDVQPIVFTGAPADWTAGPPVNWPSCVDIWQGRLWLANTPDRPTSLWGSKSGDYTIFTLPPVSAQDPIALTLASKGAIKWIRGKQSFLVGTELHEDVIVSATQVVSSLDAQLIRESGYGSAPVQAQDIGDQVVFISRDQIKLRALNFNFDTQAWFAHDISYFAQGITLPGIVDIAYVRDPDNTIYVLATDGTLRQCTYDRAAEVVAWSRWRTAGSVKAICATIDPTGTTLWIAVNRNGMNFIEKVPPFTVQTPVYLDSYNQSVPTVYLPSGETQYRISIPCGHHLDGYTVGVIVDAAYLGQAVVVAGVVDMPFGGTSASTAIVGLPYTGTLTTLPLEGGVMYGASTGLVKSRTKIFLRLLPGSYVPLINGQRAASRFPVTPMGTTQPIPAEDWDWNVVNTGFDKYARVTITQNTPFQCEIAAVFGRSEVVQN